MEIIDVKNLKLPEVKVIRFKRFCDTRGYFSETFRKNDFTKNKNIDFFGDAEFLQTNEAFSRKGVIRGLHFQFNPHMGKMVRTLAGRMIDLALDIRKDADTFGKMIAYDMPYSERDLYGEWIWVPPGFAHGNLLMEDSRVEYFCTGE
ncbi:MAG: dTDP-4-dehydrorhamnose 3,5-epimerase family protein, partial [Candidatus Spechtbacterales bacterium]